MAEYEIHCTMDASSNGERGLGGQGGQVKISDWYQPASQRRLRDANNRYAVFALDY